LCASDTRGLTLELVGCSVERIWEVSEGGRRAVPSLSHLVESGESLQRLVYFDDDGLRQTLGKQQLLPILADLAVGDEL
jgi:hypothetical protein